MMGFTTGVAGTGMLRSIKLGDQVEAAEVPPGGDSEPVLSAPDEPESGTDKPAAANKDKE